MAAAERDLRRKIKKENMESEDGINELPDDILINILSRLTIKEAAKTGILSSRWRFLWTYFTGTLDFDDLADMRCFDLPWYVRRERLLGSIDTVLGSLNVKDQSLEELRICLDLDSSCDVESWIKFAIQKRVRRLELDFHINRCNRYNFPSHFESGSLTSLRLAGVKLRAAALENLLCCCPFLVELSLEWIKSLFSIRISGPSLKLKYLELNSLLNLKDVEIDAPNLITFEYSGPELNVCLKNVPGLREISIEGECCESLLPDLFRFSDVVWQLRTLKLELGDVPDQGVPCNIPELPNLEHLHIFFVISRNCFLPCTAFLKACPLLYTLTLSSRSLLSRYERKIKKHHPHLSLRVVELVGFELHTGNVEFLLDLIESATQLEKVVIDYIDVERIEEEFCMDTEEYYQSARMHATQLAAKFPQLEFVIP